MSEKESVFLKKLKLTLLIICGPTALLIVWSLIGMYFGEAEMKQDVKQNTETLREMQKYYMTNQDFYRYHDNLINLIKANNEERKDDSKRLEKELDDFRNQFGIKTRSGNGKTD